MPGLSLPPGLQTTRDSLHGCAMEVLPRFPVIDVGIGEPGLNPPFLVVGLRIGGALRCCIQFSGILSARVQQEQQQQSQSTE